MQTKIIKVRQIGTDGCEQLENARLAAVKRDMLPLPSGFVPVRFSNGGMLMVHASRIVSEVAA